jgi:cystathionine beta-lyase
MEDYFMQETTAFIHSIPVDPLTGAVSVPIYQTSTFVQEAPGVHKGYDYARSNNPTRAVLENLVTVMEKGARGLAFASGLAAIDAVLKLLKSGDEIIAVDDIYGGAFRLFEQVYKKFGIHVTYVDASKPENVFQALNENTKLIWLETPSNPTLKIADIAAIAAVAKTGNCLLCVDNTFASPALQKPLVLGADIVIHSATKYLGGHSDLIAGIVVTATEELGEKIRFYQNAAGAILGRQFLARDTGYGDSYITDETTLQQRRRLLNSFGIILPLTGILSVFPIIQIILLPKNNPAGTEASYLFR